MRITLAPSLAMSTPTTPELQAMVRPLRTASWSCLRPGRRAHQAGSHPADRRLDREATAADWRADQQDLAWRLPLGTHRAARPAFQPTNDPNADYGRAAASRDCETQARRSSNIVRPYRIYSDQWTMSPACWRMPAAGSTCGNARPITAADRLPT